MMENNSDATIDQVMEDTLLHSPGRVKRGLLWLGSEEAKEMGLSLDLLIEQAVLNLESTKYFNLAYPATCAIGYASEGRARYYRVQEDKGMGWMIDHGFYLRGPADVKHYESLTREWCSQLQALAEERGQA